LAGLNHNRLAQAAQLQGYIQEQNAQQPYGPEYYELNPNQGYESQAQYEMDYQAQDQYQQPTQPIYYGSNPFIMPNQMQIPPGYVLSDGNRLIRNPQFGPPPQQY